MKISVDMMNLLPAQRRAEVVREMGLAAFSKMRAKTVGQMVEWVTKHPQREVLFALSLDPIKNGRDHFFEAGGNGKAHPNGYHTTRVVRKLISEADLVAVRSWVAKYPGLRSEQIFEKANTGKARFTRSEWKRALGKLRETGAVKTSGRKRSATYRVASKRAKKSRS